MSVDSVRIVLFDQSDPSRFLALTETDDPNNWKLPGGKFELGETPDQAAARELLEEVKINNDSLLNKAEELLNDDGVSRRFIYYALINVEQVSPGDDIHQVDWFDKNSVPEGKNHGHILSAVASARTTMMSVNR